MQHIVRNLKKDKRNVDVAPPPFEKFLRRPMPTQFLAFRVHTPRLQNTILRLLPSRAKQQAKPDAFTSTTEAQI